MCVVWSRHELMLSLSLSLSLENLKALKIDNWNAYAGLGELASSTFWRRLGLPPPPPQILY